MFRSKKSKKEQTIETYRKSAEALAERYDHITGTRISDIEETFALVRNKQPRVFEIGFGSGKEAYQILKRTPHYSGIDISEGMHALASRRMPRGKFTVADLEKCDYPKNLDIIFAFASLMHTEKAKLKKVFDAMYNSLVPGGLVRASLKWGPKYKELTKRDKYGVRTFYLYSKENIEAFPVEFLMLKCLVNEAEGQTWLELLLQKPRS